MRGSVVGFKQVEQFEPAESHVCLVVSNYQEPLPHGKYPHFSIKIPRMFSYLST